MYGRLISSSKKRVCICYTHFLHMDTKECTDTRPVLSPPDALNRGAFQYSGQPQICKEKTGQGGIQKQSQEEPACLHTKFTTETLHKGNKVAMAFWLTCVPFLPHAKVENSYITSYFVMCLLKWLRNNTSPARKWIWTTQALKLCLNCLAWSPRKWRDRHLLPGGHSCQLHPPPTLKEGPFSCGVTSHREQRNLKSNYRQLMSKCLKVK